MKPSSVYATLLTLLVSYVWTAQAIPAWDMYTSRENIGQLVPGTTLINALEPGYSSVKDQRFLRSSAAPGLEANLTVTGWTHDLGPPSLFFVSRGSLYQISNHTHILFANLVNATDEMAARDHNKDASPRSFFKLRLSKRRSELVGVSWEWIGRTLQLKWGGRSNDGHFYKCTEHTGETSIVVPLSSGQVPEGCETLVLASYTVKLER